MPKFKCKVCDVVFEADSLDVAVCPKCGAHATGKFCPECGTAKPAESGAAGWTCSCGAAYDSSGVCTGCGKKRPRSGGYRFKTAGESCTRSSARRIFAAAPWSSWPSILPAVWIRKRTPCLSRAMSTSTRSWDGC